MLVLTQLSAGAFCIDRVVSSFLSESVRSLLLPLHSLFALGVGLVALAASIFHLGRPLYAFRAFLGLRTSWLSREIIAFAVFAKAAVVYAAVVWREPLCRVLHCPALPSGVADALQSYLGAFVALCGGVGVFCSVMVYQATLREFWSFSRTGFKFLMTTVVLGTATTLWTTILSGALFGGDAHLVELAHIATLLSKGLMLAAGIELLSELSICLHLRDKQQNDLKRSALLLTGALQGQLWLRALLALLGGCVLPLICTALVDTGFGAGPLIAASLSLGLLLTASLVERSLFFAAVSAPRMPGGLS
jgi:DMSO reductase anchor subunit